MDLIKIHPNETSFSTARCIEICNHIAEHPRDGLSAEHVMELVGFTDTWWQLGELDDIELLKQLGLIAGNKDYQRNRDKWKISFHTLPSGVPAKVVTTKRWSPLHIVLIDLTGNMLSRAEIVAQFRGVLAGDGPSTDEMRRRERSGESHVETSEEKDQDVSRSASQHRNGLHQDPELDVQVQEDLPAQAQAPRWR